MKTKSLFLIALITFAVSAIAQINNPTASWPAFSSDSFSIPANAQNQVYPYIQQTEQQDRYIVEFNGRFTYNGINTQGTIYKHNFSIPLQISRIEVISVQGNLASGRDKMAVVVSESSVVSASANLILNGFSARPIVQRPTTDCNRASCNGVTNPFNPIDYGVQPVGSSTPNISLFKLNGTSFNVSSSNTNIQIAYLYDVANNPPTACSVGCSGVEYWRPEDRSANIKVRMILYKACANGEASYISSNMVANPAMGNEVNKFDLNATKTRVCVSTNPSCVGFSGNLNPYKPGFNTNTVATASYSSGTVDFGAFVNVKGGCELEVYRRQAGGVYAKLPLSGLANMGITNPYTPAMVNNGDEEEFDLIQNCQGNRCKMLTVKLKKETLPNCFSLGNIVSSGTLNYNWTYGAPFNFRKTINTSSPVKLQIKIGSGTFANLSGSLESFVDLNQHNSSGGVLGPVPSVTKNYRLVVNNGGKDCVAQNVNLKYFTFNHVLQFQGFNDSKSQFAIFYGSPSIINSYNSIKVWPLINCSTSPLSIRYEVVAISGVGNKSTGGGDDMNGDQTPEINTIYAVNAITAATRNALDDNDFASNNGQWSGFKFAYPHYTFANETSREIPRYVFTAKYQANDNIGTTFDSYINFTTNSGIYDFQIVISSLLGTSPDVLLYKDNSTLSIIDLPGRFMNVPVGGIQTFTADKEILSPSRNTNATAWRKLPDDKQDRVRTNNSKNNPSYSFSYMSNVNVPVAANTDFAKQRKIIRPIANCPNVIFTGITGTASPTSYVGAEIGGTLNTPYNLKCAGENQPIAADAATEKLFCKVNCNYNPPCLPSPPGSRMAVPNTKEIKEEPAPILTSKIFIAPNPVQNELTVELQTPQSGKVTYIVSDASGNSIAKGEIVCEGGVCRSVINTEGFKQGFYILQVTINGEVLTSKFIKR